jgi:terminase large subunit-like protein
MRDVARELLAALDPVYFARHKLDFVCDGWQAELLNSTSPRVLVLTSRQAGKSSTAAVAALHRALFHPGSLILMVSPSQRQSTELFKRCADFRRRLDPPPALEQDNQTSCVFANGSRVVSLPGDGDLIRGFAAPSLLLVDEAARVGDALLASVRPMLATNPDGRLIALTTPAGQRGWFHEAWRNGGDDWSRVMVTADRVPRISPEFLEAERRALGAATVDQEYMCSFLAAAGAVFDPADIARAISAEVEPLFPSGTPPGSPVPLLLKRLGS